MKFYIAINQEVNRISEATKHTLVADNAESSVK